VLAIESKCTEWIEGKEARFSTSYQSLEADFANTGWFRQLRRLRDQPNRYRYLDAAQLIKHAFGLMRNFPDRVVLLVYLYWEPRDATEWHDCLLHRQEAIELATNVCGSRVTLWPMSYLELWAEWEPTHTPRHLSWLKSRYDVRLSGEVS
jgi:hypothetical protein